MINFIAVVDDKLGLATDEGIPKQMKIKKDKEYFREKTLSGAVVMGYRTYEEFDEPLPNRPNYVAVRDGTSLRSGFEPISDVDKFVKETDAKDVWIIGGAGLFTKTIGLADSLYITRVKGDFNCTIFFPAFEDNFYLDNKSEQFSENGLSFRFEVWKRK